MVKNNKLSEVYVIIPAMNEEKHVGKVITGVKKYCDNIVLVDDGSKDKTGNCGRKEGIIVIRHITNLGKGAALKTGCDYAVMHGAKIIIVIDADGQHDPNDIPRFLKELKNADIVFGERKFNNKMPFVLKFGNLFINKITKFLYGVNLKDTQCGYRAFTVETYLKIRWEASDYSMESESVANTGRHKLKYKEVTIDTVYSDKYKGTTIFDGIKIVMNLFYWKLRGKSGKKSL